jgi:hypothetical protein
MILNNPNSGWLKENIKFRTESPTELSNFTVDNNFKSVSNPWVPERQYKEGHIVYTEHIDSSTNNIFLQWWRASTLTSKGVFNTNEWTPFGGISDLLSGPRMYHKYYIEPNETIEIPKYYQYFIFGDLTVAGTIDNYGQLVIFDGQIILEGNGVINNNGSIIHATLGSGTITILSTDSGQLLKEGSDGGNLLTFSDIISSDLDNSMFLGSDGKIKTVPTITFPDDQIFTGLQSNTTTITFTPLPPNMEGQVDYNLQVDVKTQSEITSDIDGIKLKDTFYENIGNLHLSTLPTIVNFDPNKQIKQVNIVKVGDSLKAYVNKDEDVFYKNHGISDIDLNSLTDIRVGGVAPDVISLIITSLSSNYDFSNWYANILVDGKKVGQKIIVALDINTPTLFLSFNHGNANIIRELYDTEILTVKSLEINTLYED